MRTNDGPGNGPHPETKGRATSDNKALVYTNDGPRCKRVHFFPPSRVQVYWARVKFRDFAPPLDQVRSFVRSLFVSSWQIVLFRVDFLSNEAGGER